MNDPVFEKLIGQLNEYIQAENHPAIIKFSFEILLKLNPAFEPFLTTCGKALMLDNKPDDGIKFFKRSLAIEVNDPTLMNILHTAYTNYLCILHASHQNYYTKRKIYYLSKILEISPADPKALIHLSSVYLNLFDNYSSEIYDKRYCAVHLNDYSDMIDRLNISLGRQGKANELIRIIYANKEIFRIDIFISALARLLRYMDILIFIRKYLKSNQSLSVEGYADYSYMEYMANNFDISLHYLEMVRNFDKNNRKTIYLLGKVNQASGDFDRALEYYHMLAEIDDIHDYDVYMSIVAIEAIKAKRQGLFPVDSGIGNSEMDSPDVIAYAYTTNSGSHYLFALITTILEECGYILMPYPLDYSIYRQSLPEDMREKYGTCNNSFGYSWVKKSFIHKNPECIDTLKIRTFFLVRNPMDVVSRNVMKRKDDSMSMSEFIEKSTHYYVMRYKIQVDTYFKGKFDHMVKYEDLRKDCFATLKELCEKLEVKVTADAINLALHATDFNRMKAYAKPTDNYLFKGKTDYWKDFRSTEVYELIRTEFSDILSKLGYLNASADEAS